MYIRVVAKKGNLLRNELNEGDSTKTDTGKTLHLQNGWQGI